MVEFSSLIFKIVVFKVVNKHNKVGIIRYNNQVNNRMLNGDFLWQWLTDHMCVCTCVILFTENINGFMYNHLRLKG